jgi:DNA-binding NarL/FixJ family response regulator
MNAVNEARRAIWMDDRVHDIGSSSHAEPRAGARPQVHLTPRQLEVLELLCEGLPNKLICRRLNIASGTVKAHISCILRELSVGSRLQAVIVARGLKLVPYAGTDPAAGEHQAVATYTASRQIAQVSESDQMLRAQPHA